MSSWFQNLFNSEGCNNESQIIIAPPPDLAAVDNYNISSSSKMSNQNENDQEDEKNKKNNLDSMIAGSMLTMSRDKREKALEEVNGIPQSCNSEEDPIAINICLFDLDVHLNNIKQGTAYQVAEAIDRSYVTSWDFRLMFLRADRYNPQAAAERIIKFLDLKRDLFGPGKLVKKITLQDLEEDEISYIKSGACQILPSVDSSGRKIVMLLNYLVESEITVESELRARFYFVTSLLEEPQEMQIKGITLVALDLVKEKKKANPGKLLSSVPIFIGAIHGCHSSIGSYILQSMVILLLPVETRARVRNHYGSFMTYRDNLSTFGIPKHLLPTSSESFPTKQYHDEWFEQRCKMELKVTDPHTTIIPAVAPSSPQQAPPPSSPSPPPLVEQQEKQHQQQQRIVLLVPGPMDVVLGRKTGSHTTKIKNRPSGLLKFHGLVDKYKEKYDGSARSDKTIIAETILFQLKKSGCRFLLPNEDDDGTGGYVECDDAVAREKISHRFRNLRRKSKRNK